MKVILTSGPTGYYGIKPEFFDHIVKLGIPISPDDKSIYRNQEFVNAAIEFGIETLTKYDSYRVVEIPKGLWFTIMTTEENIQYIGETWIEVSVEELQSGLTDDQVVLFKEGHAIKIKSDFHDGCYYAAV